MIYWQDMDKHYPTRVGKTSRYTDRILVNIILKYWYDMINVTLNVSHIVKYYPELVGHW
jgi:hypothetical protein